MRMPIRVLLLLAPLAAANAAESFDPEALLKADRARWAHLADVEAHHAAPPAGWTRVEEPAARAALSFPCKPQRQSREIDDRTVVQYLCTVGARGYIAQFEDRDLDDAISRLGFLAGASASIADQLRDSGFAVSVTPLHHLTYGDARGRQSRIEAAELVMELRALIRPGGTILLGARHVPGGQPGDAQRFFDSLELR